MYFFDRNKERGKKKQKDLVYLLQIYIMNGESRESGITCIHTG